MEPVGGLDDSFEECLVGSYVPYCAELTQEQFEGLEERISITTSSIRELKPSFGLLQAITPIDQHKYMVMSHRPVPISELYDTQTDSYMKVLPATPPFRANQCVFYKDMALVFTAEGMIRVIYKGKLSIVTLEGAKAESRIGKEHMFGRMKTQNIFGHLYLFYPCTFSKAGQEIGTFVRVPLSELYLTVEEAHKYNRRQKFSVSEYVQMQGMDNYTAAAFSEDYLYAIWNTGVMKRLSLEKWFDLVEKSQDRFASFAPALIATAGSSLVCIVGLSSLNSSSLRVSIVRGLTTLANNVLQTETKLTESDVTQGAIKSWKQRGISFFAIFLRSGAFHVYAWRQEQLRFVVSQPNVEGVSNLRRIHTLSVGRMRVFTTDGKFYTLNFNLGS